MRKSAYQMAVSGGDWKKAFLSLWRQRQRAQWDVWAHGEDRDLTALDERLYHLCSRADLSALGPGRPDALWRRRCARVLVDSHPEIAEVRNAIDRAFFVQGRPEDRTAFAGIMRERVLALMALRDSLARELSHASYPALVMWCEELDLDAVRGIVAATVEGEAERRRAAMLGFAMSSLSDWFARIAAIRPQPQSFSVRELSARVLKRLGVEEALGDIHIEALPREAAGFVLECGRRDIRLSISRDDDPVLLFHELGHAVARSLNRGRGVCRLLPSCTDEAMAQVFEEAAVAAPEFQDILGGRTEEARRVDALVGVLENARLCASFNFEMALWHDWSDPEGLYRKHYAEMGIEVGDAQLWPLDSFRSLDPVYVHNYVVGRAVAAATLSHLREHISAEPSPAWGRWLAEHYYRAGSGTRLATKASCLGVRSPFVRARLA